MQRECGFDAFDTDALYMNFIKECLTLDRCSVAGFEGENAEDVI